MTTMARSMNETLSTDGSGHWSTQSKEVKCTLLDLSIQEPLDADDDLQPNTFGELRVQFDMDTWDTQVDGHIYTDKKFLAELKDYLTRAGYDVRDISYSEYGMQGGNFVSLDVGRLFIASWNATL